jgi:hypothetical protein
MARFTPEGRAHRILRRLHDGTATFDGLQHMICEGYGSSHWRKFRWLTRSMIADGLIASTGAAYMLTERGRDALQRLDAGRDVPIGEPVPNVRIFARVPA